jgi:uncharacterized Ntn-hydrolase superfamily protein
MTFSIVAYDPESESWGVAVASKCLAVGHAVPWGSAGHGAVATQALANLSYGQDGLALMAAGVGAEETVRRLVADDPLAAQRQVGVVDAAGRAASYTGPGCLDWKGHLVDGGVAVQGNLLAGPQVVDRRGRQSSALRVWRAGAAYGGGLDMAVDLRVDDDPEPVSELARLVALHDLYFCRPAPGTLIELNDALQGEITDALVSLGYVPDELGGFVPAFDRWVGTENYEERNVPGSIDPLVLDALRRQAAGVAG